MGFSDCIKCWDTPCTCGWDYKHYAKTRRIALAAVILGVDPAELSGLSIPDAHPMKVKDAGVGAGGSR